MVSDWLPNAPPEADKPLVNYLYKTALGAFGTVEMIISEIFMKAKVFWTLVFFISESGSNDHCYSHRPADKHEIEAMQKGPTSSSRQRNY